MIPQSSLRGESTPLVTAPPQAALALAGLLCLGLGATGAAGQPPGGPGGPPTQLVKVERVERRELDVGQTFVGSVEAIQTSTVSSMAEGRVEELAVDEGDRVEQGAEIARLRNLELELQLAVAKRQLELSQQALEELKFVLPEEIEQARARVLAAEALSRFADARLRRAKLLFQRNSISEEDLQEKESAAAAAIQKALENKAAWRALSGSQEEKLAKAQSEVHVSQEEVARLEELAEHTVVAPFPGYVITKHTEVGQWVAKGGPVVEMVNLDWVDVEVPVPERYFSRVEKGMTARVTLAAVPGRNWEAPVSVQVPQADERSRTFRVKVRLNNEVGTDGQPLLSAGMFAQVTLAVGPRGKVLLVPKDAVVSGGEYPVLYAVDLLPPPAAVQPGKPAGGGVGRPAPNAGGPPGGPPAGPPPDGTARWVPVELGAAKGRLIEVRVRNARLLGEGDLVVVEGNERLFPHCPVAIVNRDQLGE